MISEVMIVLYNILFSSHLYFIEGQRGACAYIVVVFATQILACSTRSPESLLENRQYKSHQRAANFPSHVAERNTKCLLRSLTLYQR
jgi:hypothetical protein